MSKRFSYHLKRHFQTVDMNPYRLAKATGMHEQYVYKICRGEQRPSDEVLNKFSSVPELKVTLGELRGWRALDDYSWAELILAISAEAAIPLENSKLEAFLDGFAAKFEESGYKGDLRAHMKEFRVQHVLGGKLDGFMQDVLEEQCGQKS